MPLEKYLSKIQETLPARGPITLSDKQLLDDHRIFHAWWSTIEKKGKPLTDRRTGRPIDKEEVIRRHRRVVEEMFKRGFKHNMVDDLDQTLPDQLKRKSGRSKTVYASFRGIKSYVR